MKDYHKINSIYKRHETGPKRGRFIPGEYATPEIGYLADSQWIGTEKIDGTNIKIHWDGFKATVEGRTKKSTIPKPLQNKLDKYTEEWKASWALPKVIYGVTSVTLYGEGYGNKIQKVGKLYNPDGVDFILFDVVMTDHDGFRWYLSRDKVDSIAKDLKIKSVPVVFRGTLEGGMKFVRDGFYSKIGNAPAEGLVLVPSVEMMDRKGERIITKIKVCDVKKMEG